MTHCNLRNSRGERSTLSREHLYIGRGVVCISFWTTSRLLLALRVLHQTDSNVSLISLSNGFRHGSAQYIGSFLLRILSVRAAAPWFRFLRHPIHDTTGSSIRDAPAADVLFISFCASLSRSFIFAWTKEAERFLPRTASETLCIIESTGAAQKEGRRERGGASLSGWEWEIK